MVKIKDFTLGATGRYPRGHMGGDDQGELAAAVVLDPANAVLRIVFGKPVAWVALPAEDARALAQILVEKADELDRRKT